MSTRIDYVQTVHALHQPYSKSKHSLHSALSRYTLLLLSHYPVAKLPLSLSSMPSSLTISLHTSRKLPLSLSLSPSCLPLSLSLVTHQPKASSLTLSYYTLAESFLFLSPPCLPFSLSLITHQLKASSLLPPCLHLSPFRYEPRRKNCHGISCYEIPKQRLYSICSFFFFLNIFSSSFYFSDLCSLLLQIMDLLS